MTHGTTNKILDAALKEFSDKGYVGAKTKDIAAKSGLSEMTLFRRFKTKKNLFKQVLIKNQEDIIKKNYHILDYNKFENPDDFFRNIIYQLYEIISENFEFVNLIILEKHQVFDYIDTEVFMIINSIDEAYPDSKVDLKVLVYSIISFIYMNLLDERLGRKILHKEDFEEFINYNITLLKLNM